MLKSASEERFHPALSLCLKEYGKGVRLIDDAETDDELVDVFQSDWYRRTRARLTPGENLRIYRQNAKMTQTQLGKLMPCRSSTFRTWKMTFGLSARPLSRAPFQTVAS
jgi:hypothetical protein